MKTVYTLALCLLFSSLGWAQQHSNVKICTNCGGRSEPSIFIDPNNTNHIMAGTNMADYYYSTDGGLTWGQKQLTSQYSVAGDPCLVADNDGNFYYLHLSNPSTGSWLDRIVSQKTNNMGETWTADTYMGLNGSTDQDKEWAVVDYRNNNMFVTWTQFDTYASTNPSDSSNIMFSKSTDQGLTWSPAQRINQKAGNCLDDGNTTEGAVPAVGPNGELYVSWAGPEGLVFDRSLDGGSTWLDADIKVSDIPGPGWDFDIAGISRCNGLPITCCNLAEGPYRGDIYINWSDQRNGPDDTDIWFIKSTDGGNSWGERKRVNNDPPGKQQFFTWMTVDRVTGYIWFVFYDRRHYNDNNTDVYMAVSKDGGESFENFRISESPFLPYSSVFFGDYTNVSAHNNVVRPIWTRLEQTNISIHTAIIDTDWLSIEETATAPFSLEQNVPNPFDESTYISFKLRQPQMVSLQVFDAYGRLVCTLIAQQNMEAGKYTRHFSTQDYPVAPGLYYFSLQAGDKSVRRKMLIL